MPYFGVPIRNGLPIGLGTLTALAQAVAVVVPPVSSDPYFEYVSLLANTTSTNGAQNNTFLDSSTNNFSITRNGGNPGMTQGNFSPFSQTGWSNYFDGTGDYLQYASNAAFEFGTGNFTIEFWWYPQTLSTTQPLVYHTNDVGVTGTGEFVIVYNTSSGLRFYINAGAVDISQGSTSGWSTNQWYHVVFVRDGNTLTIYRNGVSIASGNVTGTTIGAAVVTQIGGESYDPLYSTGYISNYRVVKGTAVYTSNFTPPTAPLPLILDTSLLTCQSNRFIDNSGYQFPITRNGDTSVQAFSPFNPTAAWSASTNGGSGYFDGTGDYLSAAGNTAFDFGTGDFTVEAWVYLPATQTQFAAIACQASTGNAWYLSFGTGNTVTFGNYATTYITSSSAVSNNTWSHVAVSRSGTSLKMFINGDEVGSATNSVSLGVTANLFVGFNSATHYFNGYLSNFRIVKGTAVYTTAFTPPTAPLTAITNTSLLLNFTNAGIYDSASGNDLETVGNAQVSTTQAKWGTTSMAFDGTGDWLTVPDSPTQRFGTGDFTVEFWMYVTGGLPPAGIIGKGTSTTGWEISWQSGRTLRFTFGSTSTTSVATFNNNTWYHVALVRSGSAVGNVKLYLDGTAILTSGTAVTDNLNQTNVMYVGANRTGANAFQGYIDDLRITNGYARYTANFTPPTAAFPLN